jgi:hypothetical protein
MQAIQTKYFGPSNVRGSRIKATAAAGSVTVHYDPALNVEDNHKAAAWALRAKFNWVAKTHGKLTTGQLADGTYVHVMGEG